MTVDGDFYMYATNGQVKSGVLAAFVVGPLTLDTVKTDVNISAKSDNSQFALGDFIGMDEQGETSTDWQNRESVTLTIKDCEVKHNIYLYGTTNSDTQALSVAMISRIQRTGTVDIDNLKISGTIENNINKDDFCAYGGLFALTHQKELGSSYSNDKTFIQNITLKNIFIEGFTIKDNMTSSRTPGLLGGYWNSVNVIIGENDNGTPKNGITVKNSSIEMNGDNAKTVGGLVTSSTGYWQVNHLSYDNFKIKKGDSNTKTPDVVGLIVGVGDQWGKETVTDHRLYLELTSPTAYTISNGDPFIGTSTVFDEIVGQTIIGSDIGASGEGFVSVRTTPTDSSPILSMSSSNKNEYTPKTVLGGTQVNPYTRYYYNLDYLLQNASSGGEKATLWSAYTFAADNITGTASNQHNAKISEVHNGKGFANYSSFPTDSTINLTGLSYYPVDVSGTVSLNGQTITLYNSEIETAHGTNYSTRAHSQQYLMHCGLFRNIYGTVTVHSCTIAGNVAAYWASLKDAESKNNQGSGALVCGTVQGTAENKATLTLTETDTNTLNALSGLTISNLSSGTGSGGNMGLLINRIGSYSGISLTGIKTTGYADGAKAAHALIGTAGSSTVTQMSVTFSDIRLDSRKNSDKETTDVGAASESFETAYGTTKSIFSEATLIKTLEYSSSSGSSAVYNYNYNEDWNGTTALHHVTYGKEIYGSLEWPYPHTGSNTTDANDYQVWYLDKHAAQDTSHYTNYASGTASAPVDFSGFLPYVKTPYQLGTNYHEIAVNHISIELGEGCGTYNDPYMIDDGIYLSAVAKIIRSSGNISKGFSLYIDNDYLSSKDINFDKWCDNKTGHTRVGFNGSNFVGMKKVDDKWVEDPTISVNNITEDEIRDYLAGAYYQIENDITLSSGFVGMSSTIARYAFRGVIVGKSGESQVKIENQSDQPLIPVSNGSVVKNVEIKVTAKNINLTNTLTDKSARYDYGSGTPEYGAVIGKIMGGDNIIDDVSVKFGGKDASTNVNYQTEVKLITTNGADQDYFKYTTLIPVGGFVGTAVYGGLVFRGDVKNISEAAQGFTVNAYKSSGEVRKDTDCLLSETKYLYVNPIVGRVVNAYCFYEGDVYQYAEATQTLKNTIKNYSIPDFDSTPENLLTVTDEQITAPDSQALFTMSLITQSMIGNAESETGNYYPPNSTSALGFSFGKYYKTVHYAKYDEVGTDKAASTDFSDLAKYDISAKNETAAEPYLITHYTYGSRGNYPARALTNLKSGSNVVYRKVVLANTTYQLPECFRGIGVLFSPYNSVNTMHITELDGNNAVINIRTEFRSITSERDNYFRNWDTNNNIDNMGLGLFNELYMQGFDQNGSIADNKAYKLFSSYTNAELPDTRQMHDFTLQGYVLARMYYDDGLHRRNAAQSLPTAALLGRMDSNMKHLNLRNVDLKDMTVESAGIVGGLLAYNNDADKFVYVNDCDLNDVTIIANGIYDWQSAGGYFAETNGKTRYYINTFTDNVSNVRVTISKPEELKKSSYLGGVIGISNTGNNYKTALRNLHITTQDNGYIGWGGKANQTKAT